MNLPTGSYDPAYYERLLEGLYRRLGDYHRLGGAAYKPGLERMERLCAWLGYPERAYPVVHVAGTNGKGSVCHMVASCLSAAGYRVGLYTSPHLIDYRERIRIDGQMISPEVVIHFIERWQNQSSLDDLSFFELTTGLAFEYFASEKVDIAVIEVGMGGLLDSTNVVDPLVSVITSIGLDHQQFLGDTREKIATQKAGIIKRGRPVVVWGRESSVGDVIETIAQDQMAPLIWADRRWHLTRDEQNPIGALTIEGQQPNVPEGWAGLYTVSLGGAYQEVNLTTAIAILEQLQEQGFSIHSGAIREGLAQVQSRTGLRGRWEVISQNPLTVIDGAHNAQGLEGVFAQALTISGDEPLAIVLGSLSDRPLGEWAGYLPAMAQIIPVRPETTRARPAAELAAALRDLRPELNVLNPPGTLDEGLALARSVVGRKGVVLLTGSLYLVADVLKLMASGIENGPDQEMTIR